MTEQQTNISTNSTSMDFCPIKEKINIELLDFALKNTDTLEIDFAVVKIMKALKKCCNIRGYYEPQYQRNGVAGNGRLYCKRGLVASGMTKEWRNALAYTDYRDCDMVNASYNVALELSIKYNTPNKHLKNYITNREEILLKTCSETGKTREQVKQEKTSLLFKEHSKNSKMLVGEINILHSVVAADPDNASVVKAVDMDMKKKKDKYNRLGKIFAHIYQIREAEIMRLAVLYLKREKQEVAGLLHDGFYIKKTDTSGNEKPLYSLDSLNNYLKEIHNINVEFAYKPMRALPSTLAEEQLTLTREQSLDSDKRRYLELRELFEKEVCKILDDSKYIKEYTTSTGKIKRVAYSKTSLVDTYCDWQPAGNYKTSYITDSKAPKLFIENYILDPNKSQYNYIDFIPDPSECPDDVFNVFKGFAVARLSNTNPTITDDDTADFEQIKIWLSNLFKDKTEEQSKINYEYFIKWLANTFQRPTKRSEIMIILKGRKGIGKSDLCELVKMMIGKEHFFQSSDPANEIFGKFNETLDRKTFVNIDEPTGLDNEANIEKMKGAITCKDLNIKRKFCDTESNIAYQNYFMTLNHENTGIHITADNRRFAMFESNTMGYKDDEYLPFYNAIRNPNAQVLFYRYLMTEVNLEGFLFNRDTIPKTDFLKRSMLNNIPNYHSYMEQFILGDQTKSVAKFGRQGNGDWRGLCGDLYRGYIKFCDDIGADRQSKITQRSFKQEILSLTGVSIKRMKYGECFVLDTSEITNSLRLLGLEVAVSNPSQELEFLPDEPQYDDLNTVHTLAGL